MRALVDALRRRPELVVLTALALVTRLWSITYPPVVVWDEHHYTYFMGAYLNGTYIVDVHPPLGRLILAATAKLFGYNGMALWERNAAPLVRIVPAIFGALIVPVVYALARALGGSRPVAAIVAASAGGKSMGRVHQMLRMFRSGGDPAPTSTTGARWNSTDDPPRSLQRVCLLREVSTNKHR